MNSKLRYDNEHLITVDVITAEVNSVLPYALTTITTTTTTTNTTSTTITTTIITTTTITTTSTAPTLFLLDKLSFIPTQIFETVIWATVAIGTRQEKFNKNVNFKEKHFYWRLFFIQ